MGAQRHICKASRRGFWRARDGATAVEFALIGFPFFALLFAIFELALIFTIDSVLDNAATETGRLIRTGQASAQSMTDTQFKARLCEQMSIFESSCQDQATVDVRVVTSFDEELDNPAADGALDPDETDYSNGAPGDLMMVRVWYRQPVLTGFFAPGMMEQDNGSRLLTATTAFRNEPA